MSSELLGSAQNVLKGNLGGAWDINKGYADAYTDLGIARRFGGASAAYSLRDIGAMNGPVVRVRRDSDDTEEDFSANQVSSGALETFVQDGATQKGLTQSTWQNTGGETFSSTSTDGFSFSNSSGTAFIGVTLSETLALNDSVFVSFNASGVDIPDESPQIRLRDSVSGGSASSSLIGIVNNGFNSFELEYDLSQYSSGDNIVFSEGNTGGGTVTISDFKVFGVSRNGFVETWYDQSANLRDAIQGTATNQPSIVQNGGIVKVNSKPAITFNASDNFLEVDGSGSAVAYSFSPSGDMGMFIVSKQFTGNVIDSRDGAGDGIFLQQASADTTRFRYNGDGSIDITATRDAQHLSTMTLDGTTLSASVDGGTAGTDTVTAGVSTTNNLVIGKAFSGNNSNFLDGEIQEAIFYENNKTSEKSNIETDIDNFYSIT